MQVILTLSALLSTRRLNGLQLSSLKSLLFRHPEKKKKLSLQITKTGKAYWSRSCQSLGFLRPLEIFFDSP